MILYGKNGRGYETMMKNNVKKIIKNLQWILNHRLVQSNKLRTIFRYFWFHLTIKKDGIFTYKILNQKLTIRKGHGSQTNYYTYFEDYNEMMFSLHYLNESERFLDVGANVGVYSILVASQKRSEVIAIEPMKKNYDLLLRNIKMNNLSKKVIPINIGLGDCDGDLKFKYNGALSGYSNDGGIGEVVKVKKMESIIDFAHLIKVDVEGFEIKVLNGGEKVLNDQRTNALIIEMVSFEEGEKIKNDVLKILTNKKFSPYKYHPRDRSLENLTLDNIGLPNTLFIRDIKMARKKVKAAPKINVFGTDF